MRQAIGLLSIGVQQSPKPAATINRTIEFFAFDKPIMLMKASNVSEQWDPVRIVRPCHSKECTAEPHDECDLKTQFLITRLTRMTKLSSLQIFLGMNPSIPVPNLPGLRVAESLKVPVCWWCHLLLPSASSTLHWQTNHRFLRVSFYWASGEVAVFNILFWWFFVMEVDLEVDIAQRSSSTSPSRTKIILRPWIVLVTIILLTSVSLIVVIVAWSIFSSHDPYDKSINATQVFALASVSQHCRWL